MFRANRISGWLDYGGVLLVPANLNGTRLNFLVSIIDFPPDFQIDGVLGMDFMGKYRITIETDTATLVLRGIPKKK